MSTRSNAQGQPSGKRWDRLYARLGLTPRATRAEVDRAREEIVGFLEGAPEGVGRWARNEARAVNEAHARLTDTAAAAGDGNPRLRRLAIGVATLAVTIGVVIAVYNLGGGESDPGSQQDAAAGEGLSPAQEARVGQLMRQLKTDPKDVMTLMTLGDIYFKTGDYNAAGSWMDRAVATEPGNVKARLALGAALFNLGDSADAEQQWLRVVEIDPRNVEAYYDLGFLYLSEEPPEMTQAKQMWRKVVEIAPDSDVAKTVATHLKGLKESGLEADAPPTETG